MSVSEDFDKKFLTDIMTEQEKRKTEDNIRLAESLIQKAKECFYGVYDDYADVQKLVHTIEGIRQETEMVLTKFLDNKLT